MRAPLVFISYAREDRLQAGRLYRDLCEAGIQAWLDEHTLRPGQRWKSVVSDAIRSCRYFLAVLSSSSVSKRGFVQREITQALEMLDEFPESAVYLILARLDSCRPSHAKLLELHWVDLFPDWQQGIERIIGAMRETDFLETLPSPRSETNATVVHPFSIQDSPSRRPLSLLIPIAGAPTGLHHTRIAVLSSQ
jgi:hypothetical protein